MKYATGLVLAALLACDANPTDHESAAAQPTSPALSQGSGSQAGNAAVQGSLVRGQGTLGLVPAWASMNSLGDSPIKIDSNGNVILKPGASLFLVNEDGSKCIKITGEFITFPYKTGETCPTF